MAGPTKENIYKISTTILLCFISIFGVWSLSYLSKINEKLSHLATVQAVTKSDVSRNTKDIEKLEKYHEKQ